MEKANNLSGNGAMNNSTVNNVKNFRNAGRSASTGVASTHSATKIEDTQWVKYRNPRGGHGFAAEDVNSQIDRWHGRKVQNVGRDNAPNGADRIVNGQKIQTKYCPVGKRDCELSF